MKKRLASFFIFILSLSLGFIYLNKAFSTENHFNNTIASFNKTSKNDTIDILIFGSSHAYTAFNPLVIDKLCGTTTFNLGSDDLRVPITGLILEEALQKTKPKLIILEIYPSSIIWPNNDESKGFHLRVFDKISNLSINKWKLVNKVYNKDEILGVYFPLFRNHGLWNKNKYFYLNRDEKINDTDTFFYNGYIGKSLNMDITRSNKFKNFTETQEYSNSKRVFINKLSEEDIVKLINIAKTQNTQVLVVSAPDVRAKSYWNNSFISNMNRICADNNVEYLNLNDFYNHMNLNINDFKDPSHLNISGAYKTSLFLGKFVSENYTSIKQPIAQRNLAQDTLYQQFLNKYINITNKTFEKKVRRPFTQSINLDSISIHKKGSNLDFSVFLNTSKKDMLEITNYNLLVKVHPKKSDLPLVANKNKSKNWEYDKIDVKLEDYKDSIFFQIPTKIINIEKIEMLLYNKEKYNGPIGDRIFITNISFH